MGGFADTILSVLFGWLQALVNQLWSLIDRGGSALGAWFLRNWLPLTLLLIAVGLVVDWIIWMIRWQPYHVWATRLRRIGRFFRRSSGTEEDLAYAEGIPQEDWQEEPGPEEYAEEPLNAYQTEVYDPVDTLDGGAAPTYVAGNTYVEPAQEAWDAAGDPDFQPEEYAPEDGAYVDAGEPYAEPDDDAYTDAGDDYAEPDAAYAEDPDWNESEPLPEDAGEDAWAPFPEEQLEVWNEPEAGPSPEGEDGEDGSWAPYDPATHTGGSWTEPVLPPEGDAPAYRELIPLDEEDEEYDTAPPAAEEPEAQAEASETEAEPMYDDFSNHGAPEPPQKRRRWEFPEEEAPATSRRKAPEEAAPPSRRNSRPPEPEAASPRRRAAAEQEPELSHIDPLAAYDDPDAMEQMQQSGRRQSRPPRAADVEDYPQEDAPYDDAGAATGEESRRRRRSRRHRQVQPIPAPGVNPDFAPDDEYPQEGPPPQEEADTGRRRRSGRRGRRARDAEYVEEASEYTQEEGYSEAGYEFHEGYEEQDGYYDDAGDDGYYQNDGYDDGGYDNGNYAEDGYDEDYPDAPEWRDWDDAPDPVPDRGGRGGTTKPSLFDRLRGVKKDQPADFDDDGGDWEDDAPQKKKGLFSRFFNPDQPEFQPPKPKPRVRQEDAYREPVYPPKKRR